MVIFKLFSQNAPEYLSCSSPSLFSAFFKYEYLALHLRVSVINSACQSIVQLADLNKRCETISDFVSILKRDLDPLKVGILFLIRPTGY